MLVVQAGCNVVWIAWVGVNAGMSLLLLPVWQIKLTQTSMVLACCENTGKHTCCRMMLARSGKVMLSVGAEEGAHTAASFSWPCCAGSQPPLGAGG